MRRYGLRETRFGKHTVESFGQSDDGPFIMATDLLSDAAVERAARAMCALEFDGRAHRLKTWHVMARAAIRAALGEEGGE